MKSGESSIRKRAEALELTLQQIAQAKMDTPSQTEDKINEDRTPPTAKPETTSRHSSTSQGSVVEGGVTNAGFHLDEDGNPAHATEEDRVEPCILVPENHVTPTMTIFKKNNKVEDESTSLSHTKIPKKHVNYYDTKSEASAHSIKEVVVRDQPSLHGFPSEYSLGTRSQSMMSKDDEDDLDDEDDEDRQQWSNPIEFLLSCIAMSVGLGNVWRFPFTAYENGGGAFLIPYIIVLLTIGRPLYFMELALGQFASRGSVKVWDMVPGLRGVGFGQLIANSSVISYYTCLIALAVFYLGASFSSELPWTLCDDELTPNGTMCIPSGSNTSSVFQDLVDQGKYGADTKLETISAAEQYFRVYVLHEKKSIEDGLGYPDYKLVICLAICYLMVFLTLWKGVASSGKVAYFTALFPYVILIALLARGVTLPGSLEGILFYIRPQWEQLLNVNVWYAAVTQSFFSLSVGFGSLITYSSYNDFRHNTYRDALIISIADTFTSLLAGFTIFSILGNLAVELDKPIDEVINSGTGLAFISYPMAIGKFDFYPQVFSVMFFVMLITLGLGSVTGLSSGVIAIVCDQKPNWNKTKVTFVICVIGFLVGLVYITPGGQHILNLVDYLGGGFVIFSLAILEVIGVSWVYGMRRFIRDIQFMIEGVSIGLYWKFCWGIFVPVSLTLILVYSIYQFEWLEYSGVPLPEVYVYAGMGFVLFALLQVPFWLCYSICMVKGDDCTEKIALSWKPNESWGPKKAKIRREWLRAEAEHFFDEAIK